MNSTLTLVKSKSAFTVQPLGWRIHGVIGPVERWWHISPRVLLCSAKGLAVARRSYRGFWASDLVAGLGGTPTIGGDFLWDLPKYVAEIETVFPVEAIVEIKLQQSFGRNRITLRLSDERRVTFYIFARASTDAYRAFLERTYPEIYTEKLFSGWLSRLAR